MNDLLAFMSIAFMVFIGAWFMQLGAHPYSARSTFAAIVMTISILLIAGCVVLTLLNLFLMAWL